MTLVELSVVPSILTGAIGGAIAGSAAGPWLAVGGGLAGAVLGFIAALAVVGVTGLIALAFGGEEQKPRERPLGRLHELGFFLFVSPIWLAPVWVPIVTYRVVALVVEVDLSGLSPEV